MPDCYHPKVGQWVVLEIVTSPSDSSRLSTWLVKFSHASKQKPTLRFQAWSQSPILCGRFLPAHTTSCFSSCTPLSIGALIDEMGPSEVQLLLLRFSYQLTYQLLLLVSLHIGLSFQEPKLSSCKALCFLLIGSVLSPPSTLSALVMN